MVQGHAGVAGRLGDVRSVPTVRLERGCRELDVQTLQRVDRYAAVRHGRQARISGAGEGVAVLSGSCGMCGVRWKQAAACGEVASPSHRSCSRTHRLLDLEGFDRGAVGKLRTAWGGSEWVRRGGGVVHGRTGLCRRLRSVPCIQIWSPARAFRTTSLIKKNACNGRRNGRHVCRNYDICRLKSSFILPMRSLEAWEAQRSELRTCRNPSNSA